MDTHIHCIVGEVLLVFNLRLTDTIDGNTFDNLIVSEFVP